METLQDGPKNEGQIKKTISIFETLLILDDRTNAKQKTKNNANNSETFQNNQMNKKQQYKLFLDT